MTAFMTRFQSETYALLRIVTGFLFLWHGTMKLLGFPEAIPYELPMHIKYVGGSIELIGGTLVMLGLCTRPAAFICSGFMAAAYWTTHGTNAVFPIINEGELAALYCFVFLAISAHGSGIWSVDTAMSKD
jgi:putative oxidoreductase